MTCCRSKIFCLKTWTIVSRVSLRIWGQARKAAVFQHSPFNTPNCSLRWSFSDTWGRRRSRREDWSDGVLGAVRKWGNVFLKAVWVTGRMQRMLLVLLRQQRSLSSSHQQLGCSAPLSVVMSLHCSMTLLVLCPDTWNCSELTAPCLPISTCKYSFCNTRYPISSELWMCKVKSINLLTLSLFSASKQTLGVPFKVKQDENYVFLPRFLTYVSDHFLSSTALDILCTALRRRLN